MLASFFRGTQTVRDKCYVTHWGSGGVRFPRKKRYEGVRLNVISITRWWVWVKFPEKKRYVRMSPKRGGGGRITVVACAIPLTALTSDDLEA